MVSATNMTAIAPTRKNHSLRRVGLPFCQLVLPPCHEVVCMLMQLWPRHHPGSAVWGHKRGTLSTLRECTHLLAHVLAMASESVLCLHTGLQALCLASPFVLASLQEFCTMISGSEVCNAIEEVGNAGSIFRAADPAWICWIHALRFLNTTR